MIKIDQYAYTSRLKQTDPLLKLFFGGLTLGVCLWADSLPIALLILALMSRETVCNGGIPLAVLLKLLLVPMSFLIIGVLTIAIDVSAQQRDFWWALPIWGVHLGISATGGQQAVRLFWKALGAAACLYYISLSTPMVDLLSALRRLHVPALLVELMGLIYRFIFVLFETAETMLTAQTNRHRLLAAAQPQRAAALALLVRPMVRGRSLRCFIAWPRPIAVLLDALAISNCCTP